MSVGAATNIAHALKKYPALSQEAAGIIYMGGDIDVPGNATPAAEMNWYYDPDAVKLCLAANWKKQLIIPDDLSRHIRLTQAFYDRLAVSNTNPITRFILPGKKTFTEDSANYVWDVLVPVIFLKPGIITDLQERYITVDSTPGINSGRAVSWTQHEHNDMKTGRGFPDGVRKADIVRGIDAPAFWDFYVEMLTMK